MSQRRAPRRRLSLLAAFALGLATLGWLLATLELDAIGALLARLGLGGLLAVTAAHLLPVTFAAGGWVVLLQRWRWFPHALWLRTLADMVNALLPVASVGGEMVRARALARAGVDPARAAASVIVDVTLGFAGLLLFVGTGLGALLLRGATGLLAPLVGGGVLLALLLLLGWVQRGPVLQRASGWLERLLPGRDLSRLHVSLTSVHREVASSYRRPGRVLLAVLWRFAAWLGGAAEIWVALHLLGIPVSWVDVIILDAVAQLARNAGFAIPLALGAQEVGYVAAGALVGLAPEVGLSLALIKRGRDLLLGLPVLGVWQVLRARRLAREHRASQPAGPGQV